MRIIANVHVGGHEYYQSFSLYLLIYIRFIKTLKNIKYFVIIYFYNICIIYTIIIFKIKFKLKLFYTLEE